MNDQIQPIIYQQNENQVAISSRSMHELFAESLFNNLNTFANSNANLQVLTDSFDPNCDTNSFIDSFRSLHD